MAKRQRKTATTQKKSESPKRPRTSSPSSSSSSETEETPKSIPKILIIWSYAGEYGDAFVAPRNEVSQSILNDLQVIRKADFVMHFERPDSCPEELWEEAYQAYMRLNGGGDYTAEELAIEDEKERDRRYYGRLVRSNHAIMAYNPFTDDRIVLPPWKTTKLPFDSDVVSPTVVHHLHCGPI